MKSPWIITSLFFILIFFAWYLVIHFGKDMISHEEPKAIVSDPIKPSETHSQYWSRAGENILLLGGSDEDNLFQMPDFEEQLDLLMTVGGNYVRNTMSSRDEGNLWPFAKNDSGYYDLNTWNDAYWERFNHFLQACSDRDIIVQIELWATFDFYRENWLINPFNPANNINYTVDRVHLPVEVNSHPTRTENDFFWSVPSQKNNLKLLEFQQKYIDKVLSYTLQYDNILYCMDNETSVTADWGKFWSEYIKKIARENGKEIYTTEMWDPWDLNHIVHRETLDHPEIYDFADISQNNHNAGDTHWNNAILLMRRLASDGMLRPLNNVKVYGNDGGAHQTTQNGIDSFVKNILVGASGARFHRPTSGQGLNETAQSVIKSMRMLSEKSDLFNGTPANELLENREENEAFCRAVPGNEYIIYFPGGGDVDLLVPNGADQISVEWLQINNPVWEDFIILPTDENKVKIKTPDQRSWLAYLKIN